MAVTTPTASQPPATGGTTRPLESDKAKRIVDAMRESVAARGAAGSTFDHVAREAGVSRGLLHYYFATKERLLAEVVRHDTDVRMTLLVEPSSLGSKFTDISDRDTVVPIAREMTS